MKVRPIALIGRSGGTGRLSKACCIGGGPEEFVKFANPELTGADRGNSMSLEIEPTGRAFAAKGNSASDV